MRLTFGRATQRPEVSIDRPISSMKWLFKFNRTTHSSFCVMGPKGNGAALGLASIATGSDNRRCLGRSLQVSISNHCPVAMLGAFAAGLYHRFHGNPDVARGRSAR